MAVVARRNHPIKGSQIKVEPIRDRAAIEKIKILLTSTPRDYCLFVLGINTAFRANELVSITCGQVRHLRPGDLLELMQTKTSKRRAVAITQAEKRAQVYWLDMCRGGTSRKLC